MIKAGVPIFVLCAAIVSLPLIQLDFFRSMPGDIGDARLNNYFLENAHQYFFGASDSLWHLSFFYPFPYVLGFSDNLFGSVPSYILARVLGAAPDTAFQVWFLIAYLVNFWAAYFALRKLGIGLLGASAGALIFAFALPTSAHVDHAQLHYRFGIPLAVVFFFEFLERKCWKSLLIAGFWLVWQFYAGVYMGFFTLLLLLSMLVTYLGYDNSKGADTKQSVVAGFVENWRAFPGNRKLQYLLAFAMLAGLMALLFFPYLQVSQLYGAKRTWAEISSMLPRPQSYLLSDASFWWSNPDARVFASLPMRHEHQMFIGLLPLVFALLGIILGSRATNGAVFTVMIGMLVLTILLTLYVGGYSVWYFFHKLPLASAIRAMTRLDQAILFPVAYLAAVGIENVRARIRRGSKPVGVLILLVLLLEMSMTTMKTDKKEAWRQRISQADELVPPGLPRDAILFFAQKAAPFYASELDAMWVAINRGVRTLNGYSGLAPPGYTRKFGNDCTELYIRVVSYLNFSQPPDPWGAYQDIVSRVVPLGFDDCDARYLREMPTISFTDRIYSRDEMSHLSIQLAPMQGRGRISGAVVSIINAAEFPFPARSSTGKFLRLAWRFLNSAGVPLSGWGARKDLPFDIPAKDRLTVHLPLRIPPNAATLQVSMLQEPDLWAHDIGMEPAQMPLK